jgi:hypothetical protein
MSSLYRKGKNLWKRLTQKNRPKIYADDEDNTVIPLEINIPDPHHDNRVSRGKRTPKTTSSSRSSAFSPENPRSSKKSVSGKDAASQFLNLASVAPKSNTPSLQRCKVYLKYVIDRVSEISDNRSSQEMCQAVLDKCKEIVLKVEEPQLTNDINAAYENDETEKKHLREQALKCVGLGGKKTRKHRKSGKKNAKRRKSRRHR